MSLGANGHFYGMVHGFLIGCGVENDMRVRRF